MSRVFYIDSSDEPASNHILNEIGVSIVFASVANGFQEVTTLSKLHELTIEHKSSQKLIYKIVDGEVNLDIRDSANAWVRCCLSPGHIVTIASGTYHRFSHPYISSVRLSIERIDDGKNIIGSLYQPRFNEDSDNHNIIAPVINIRQLICDLCSQFFYSGWVTGTGGSISIRHGNRIYMTPSGVPKERLQPDELFLLDSSGTLLQPPNRKVGAKIPKLTDCSPLFFHCYQIRNAGIIAIRIISTK
jgi:methylthioribulose 1-phosphate dehydratase/enolase-phosphatase E1